MKNGKGFSLVTTIVIVCIASIVSGITVGIIITNNYGMTYKSLANDESLNEFLQVYSNIIDNYYEDIDKDAMLDSAVDAMLNYLGDNYTTYLDSDETTNLENLLAGSYQGIGVTIKDQTIIEISNGSPAEKAGLQVGDIFVEVDGTNVSNSTTSEISALIRNAEKKNINIVVLRGTNKLTFNVEIGTILTSSIDYKMLDNSIGYIDMQIFSKTLTDQVETALNELETSGMQKLIIDLRDNTGGYLDSAEGTASLFLEKGKLIYSLEDNKTKEDYYDETTTSRHYPIVVLINEKSASAAEILTAALKDSYGVIIVGQKSYGKGKVQQTYNLEDGSMAKYTSARWLRPDGSCIDGIGIYPDYVVINSDVRDEYGNIVDDQLTKALEVINTLN